MSSIPNENFNIYKGQHKNFVISIINELGSKDISTDTLEFKVFVNPNSTPIITKTTADVAEIEKTDTSEITVKFIPADTSTLDADRYYFQLWDTDGTTSDILPVLTGYFFINVVAPSLVKDIRGYLDEAGEKGIKQINSEPISPTTTTLIFAPRRRISAVQGVWLLTDNTHTGTNYYTGGGFDSLSGAITLGTALPNVISDIRASYTWESGIEEDVIQQHLNSARIWTIGFSGESFIYNATSTDEQKQAEQMSLALTIVLCVLTVNGANMAQMGYNFRVQDFEIQSKLWGEGMIAQALFEQYNAELMRWMLILGKVVNYAWADRNFKYKLNKQIGYTVSGTEGSER